ncbi:hypothetical protein [Thauera sp. 63]|uniref:hypothetical protein n=1 Tax=Thauera sp. 63 TaxID=497321 RepID=UPI00030DBBF7|nr:hypothetical protein [Thauera sp. 63]
MRVGINHEAYDPALDHIVTATSLTTNCLAPLVKAVHKNLGIRHGQISSIHDSTNTKLLVDAPHKGLLDHAICARRFVGDAADLLDGDAGLAAGPSRCRLG